MPHVAVVVPCYNYGGFLPGCVESIVRQPGVTTDVVVIDDASTDGSADIAAELAARHPEVRVICHEKNMGHIATFNEGLSAADSDYLVLLSADDMLAPGALRRATGLMEARPSVGLVYGHPQQFSTTPVESATKLHSWSVWAGDEWIRAQFRRGLNLIYSPEAVVRTSVHHEAGYYRDELPHSGDLEMWLRLAALADVGRVNGPDQAYRRVHPESMMRTYYASVVEDLERRDDAYESFLRSGTVPRPDSAALRATVHRKMSKEALGWACGAMVREGDTVDVRAAVHFAQRISPDYATFRVWREFRYLSHTTAGTAAALAAKRDSLQRELAANVEWRRWRYFGV